MGNKQLFYISFFYDRLTYRIIPTPVITRIVKIKGPAPLIKQKRKRLMKPIFILITCLMVGLTAGQNADAAGGSATVLIPFNQAGENFFEELEKLKNRFEQLLDIIDDVPDSEEFKALEKELNRLAEEINRSGNSMKEQIQNDVLPQLENMLESLKDRLRRLNREKEMKPRKIELKRLYAI